MTCLFCGGTNLEHAQTVVANVGRISITDEWYDCRDCGQCHVDSSDGTWETVDGPDLSLVSDLLHDLRVGAA